MISETTLPCASPDPSGTFPVFGKEDVIARNPIDLRAIVQRTVDKCLFEAAASGVSLRFNSEEPYFNIMGDEDKMEQIVTGLIQSCLGMTTSGDVIQVKLLRTEIASRSFARTIIKDNGSGIEPDDLERIFDAGEDLPSFASFASIEKFIVLQDGGICIRSLRGVGTRFAIDFPLLSD